MEKLPYPGHGIFPTEYDRSPCTWYSHLPVLCQSTLCPFAPICDVLKPSDEYSWELGQYHRYWCPGSLRRQVISSHGIDCKINKLLSSKRKDFNYWYQLSAKKLDEMEIHIYAPINNSACKGLIHPSILIIHYISMVLPLPLAMNNSHVSHPAGLPM